MAFTRYSPTPKAEPFKPGDEIQFRVDTVRGHGYFLGQVWCYAPGKLQYWIATDKGFHLAHRSDLRLVAARGTSLQVEVQIA